MIHIVESLDRGAVENWLVRMMEHGCANGETPDWTFFCQLPTPGSRESHVLSMGGKIVRSQFALGRTGSFMAALRAELRRGDYDVMHCHHDLVNAVYMAASFGLPVRRRIVQAHNADECLPTASSVKAALLREPMRRVCLAADNVIGISNHTLDTFLGGRRRRPGKDLVHYYGVSSGSFQEAVGDRKGLRRSLDLPESALILLFGGRITPEKNPVFAVDVLAALAKREPRSVGVFAGMGSLEEAVKKRAAELGVADRLRMIGWRADLAEVMCASDWFILPRPEAPMEGFGLAVVEAQLAGLRMLLSRGVPDDPLLPTGVYRRLALADSPSVWSQAALEMLDQPTPSREDALGALADSPMDMDRAFTGLMALYE